MGTGTKSTLKSKTIWFGIIAIALGATSAILAFLDAQGWVSAQTGVTTAIMGVITIILRYKTTVAIALGIDDPTTPEDESKGERAAKDSGFAVCRLLLLIAALSFVVISLTGCAHLTPKEQQAVNATIDCSTDILTSAQTCVPECLEIADKDDQKSCAVACVIATLESVAPTCSKVYGDIYSPELGTAISATVVSIMQIYEAVDK